MTDARSAAEALVQGFADAWNARDMDAFGALFAADATFVNRFGACWRGREALTTAHADILAGIYRQSRLRTAVREVDLLSETAAVVLVDGHLEVGAAMTQGPRELDTLMLTVITCEAGTWRIRAAENVLVTPPPGTDRD